MMSLLTSRRECYTPSSYADQLLECFKTETLRDRDPFFISTAHDSTFYTPEILPGEIDAVCIIPVARFKKGDDQLVLISQVRSGWILVHQLLHLI